LVKIGPVDFEIIGLLSEFVRKLKKQQQNIEPAGLLSAAWGWG